MSQKKRVNLSNKVGADFFQSDNKQKSVKESNHHDAEIDQSKLKTTVYFTPDVHKKLRIECATNGVKISTFIESLIVNHFDSKPS